MNKTPILGDGRMQNTLMLIDVAYLGKNENDSLVFFDGNKLGIWPSTYCMMLTTIALFIVTMCLHWQIMSHMMAHLGQRS